MSQEHTFNMRNVECQKQTVGEIRESEKSKLTWRTLKREKYTVDCGRHAPSLLWRSTGVGRQAINVPLWSSSKTHFSHLKEETPQNISISLSVRYIALSMCHLTLLFGHVFCLL